MDRFIKNNGKLFMYIYIGISALILVYAFMYGSQFHSHRPTTDRVTSLYESNAKPANNFFKLANDMLLYTAFASFVVLALLAIINVYKRRHFMKFHLLFGIIAIVLPLPLLVLSVVFNLSGYIYYTDYMPDIYRYVENKGFFIPFGSGATFVNALYGIVAVYIIGLISNIFYFVMRYKLETKESVVE